ncbi:MULTISPECIES: restriction endonuclease subunit S [Vibrio]|uniref:restriction endonuclease subunit S n=1 Tax=Vibrio sp. S512-13 TaxID=1620394 RepID=UPI000A4EFDD9|nr:MULTISPECIES: restriction endonuclease subunit S [Vibrio]MCS0192775.1 restriction endonuclease subunit S [Vibrio parahaemolyticus]
MTDTMITQMPKYESMQDSGFEWIGDIPSSWNLLSVKQIYRLVMEESGKNHNLELLSVYSDIGVRPRAELEEKGNKASSTDGYWLVRKGDFVVNKLLAWMGGLGLSEYDGVTSPAYDVLRPRKEICGSYFNYLFRSPACTSELKKHSRGIMDMRLRLYFDKFGVVKVPFPSLKEQKAISNFLDKRTSQIDEAIAIKQKQIELLKERKQIIIQQAVTQGLNPDAPMKDSGVDWIGEVPEHWEVKKLKNICRTFGRIGFRGYSTSDLVDKDEGAITISPSNINEDTMSFQKCSFLSWEKYHESPEIKVNNEDILIVKTGSSFGKVGYVESLPNEATINPQLLVFKDISINNKYLYFTMKSSLITVPINQEIIGSTIPTISESKILNFKILLPDEAEQREIVSHIESEHDNLNSLIQAQVQQIETLKEYKTTLINSAVTGKIKVTELA